MQISLISPLSVEECIVRFEAAKKKDNIPFSREYTPPYGELIGNTFNLGVNIGKYLPFMQGEFIRIAKGTLIACSMELPKATQRLHTLWLIFVLPVFACFVIFAILNGFEDDFSETHFVTTLIGIDLSTFYYYILQVRKRQIELDKQELLEF